MTETFLRTSQFIHRHARPLDMARWRYHFEEGSQQAVLDELKYYQNADGGFGYAVEADCWNPASTPIQTWCAAEVLRETGITDAGNPLIAGILRYLESGRDFDGKCWYNAVRSNNDYPHAPWWQADADNAHDYNPTAYLAGFVIRYAQPGSELWLRGCRIAREAVSAYMAGGFLDDMHVVSCYIRLLQYCEESGYDVPFDMRALRMRLRGQVEHSISRDYAAWENSYVCKPSQFFCSANDKLCAGNESAAAYECDFIVRTQADDGSWNVNWNWGAYPDEWGVSKYWWKCDIAIKNMLFLKGFNRL